MEYAFVNEQGKTLVIKANNEQELIKLFKEYVNVFSIRGVYTLIGVYDSNRTRYAFIPMELDTHRRIGQ